ncbi:MAG: hypothetical protein ABIH36_01355 [bacterium]
MKIEVLIIIGIVAVLIIIFIPQVSTGERDVAVIENIHGIPFARRNNSQIITEKLAHADIYLKNSPLAKKITLTITLTPHNTNLIRVGIRENAFWLSYAKHELYHSAGEETTITRTVTIPLTDKIIDSNGSVDLMFFTSTDWTTEYEGTSDTTYWELNSIDAEVSLARPTRVELKNYLRSKLTNEKPA